MTSKPTEPVVMAYYRITVLIEAPKNTTIINDALSSGIMGAFEPNEPFIVHAIEIDQLETW